MRRAVLPLLGLPLALYGLLGALPRPTPRPAREIEPQSANTDEVRHLLGRRCSSCHGAHKQRGGLRLDLLSAAVRGGKSGPAVVPGHSADSLLIKAVTGHDDVSPMPPSGPRLTPEDVRALCAWIDQGARADDEKLAEGRHPHWAFRPPVRPALPAVRYRSWCRSPIDRFILARLEREGLQPSAEADRVTLLRRVTLDLLGVPPTVEEVDAFLADDRPEAYEFVVERLLASPHYGERWGRHWLDVARYADTDGYNRDAPRSIWKYRDWVIAALNDDMPYDRFLIEQIAGDLLPGATTAQRIATGFHRNTLSNKECGVDPEQFRVEAVADRVNTTGAAILGLTLGCSRCHDHRSDPITQREYYQLFAFFNDADEKTLELPMPQEEAKRDEVRAEVARLLQAFRQAAGVGTADEFAWEKTITPAARAWLPEEVQDALAVPAAERDAEQRARLAEAFLCALEVRQLASLVGAATPIGSAAQFGRQLDLGQYRAQVSAARAREPKIVSTLVLTRRAASRTTHVHIKGDFTRPGETVAPGVLACLPPLPEGAAGDRLDLARWLADPQNPLPARVMVNRLWQQYFGVGLVETENDFGIQGARPSHPELLDWLATEFARSGWSLKAMHRLIVTSATYRQSSHVRRDLAAVDPRNRLLARQARLRLEAEAVRDSALAASGLWCRDLGGPSVYPPQPPEVGEFATFRKSWPTSTGTEHYRRGMYTCYMRAAPYPALVVFDAPDAVTTCTRRGRSTTPLQALTLLNDEAFVEIARGLAARVLQGPAQTDAERIRYAFRLCLVRVPGAVEQARLERLLAEQLDEFQSHPDAAREIAGGAAPDAGRLAAWTVVARALLNLDEFITRE